MITLPFLVIPRFVQDTRASTLFRAVNDGCKFASPEFVNGLGEDMWTLLAETPDNAKPNRRNMFATAKRITRKRALYVPGGCVVHGCYRIVTGSSPKCGKLTLAGGVYSVKFVTSVCSHFNRLCKALHCILSRELEWLRPDRGDDFDWRWSKHVEELLQHSFLRKSLTVRARLEDVGEALKPGVLEKSQKEVVKGVCMFLNGDARAQKVVHVCRGCCKTREDAVENVYSALLKIVFSATPEGCQLSPAGGQ